MVQDKSKQTKLSEAKTKLDQATARYRDLKAQHKASQRRDKKRWDDRRKILAGACVLSVAKTDKQLAEQLIALLDTFLTRRDERAVFPELPTPDG